MGDLRKWLRFRRGNSRTAPQLQQPHFDVEDVVVLERPSAVEQPTYVVSEGVHYLATQQGFLRKYEREFEDGRCVGHKPVFTNNPRLARTYGTFDEADRAGKLLASAPRRWIKYYAIVKPA